jgi:endonuclease/exonuclease/phosphatase (EEP) superfamily protein YafD
VTVPERRPRWHTLAKALVSLALLAVCAWWALLFVGPEHSIFSGAYLYLPFWMGLVPLVVSAGLAWPLGWRWRGIAAATLFVFLWPVMGFSTGSADDGAGRVRLMTYNIKSYLVEEVTGFDGVIAEIKQHDPDILVMQDAEALDLASNSDAALLKRMVGTRQVFAFGQYVVASRFPLRGCGVGSIAYDEHPHTFVHCIVTAHGQDVDLTTTHLLSPRDGLNAMRWNVVAGYGEWQANAEDRVVQAEKLAQTLANRRRPAIVAGDLNAPERSVTVRTLLDTGLRDAFSSAGWGYGYTHGHSLKPHLFSTIRIDHILVSREIGVAGCFVGGKDGSEHRPVIADLWVY